MATRSYQRRQRAPESVERVLDAAERLIKEGTFHAATMDELAAAAGVSRATLFNRFGSKLGVLQALFIRGMQGPRWRRFRRPSRSRTRSQRSTPRSRPAARSGRSTGRRPASTGGRSPRAGGRLARRRAARRTACRPRAPDAAPGQRDRLRPGLSQARATATLHMLTSLESFLWLRQGYGLSLRQTRETLAELARAAAETVSMSPPAG